MAANQTSDFFGYEEQGDQSTRFPVHVEALSAYFGKEIDDRIEEVEFTETSVLQPNPGFEPYLNPTLSLNTGLLLTNSLLNLYRKAEDAIKERAYKPDPDKRYVQKPTELPGFPDATKVRGRTPFPSGIRPRWKLSGGKILEWDSQHGEVEMYDKNGKHIGAFDYETGEKIKDAKNDRNIKKYL